MKDIATEVETRSQGVSNNETNGCLISYFKYPSNMNNKKYRKHPTPTPLTLTLAVTLTLTLAITLAHIFYVENLALLLDVAMSGVGV